MRIHKIYINKRVLTSDVTILYIWCPRIFTCDSRIILHVTNRVFTCDIQECYMWCTVSLHVIYTACSMKSKLFQFHLILTEGWGIEAGRHLIKIGMTQKIDDKRSSSVSCNIIGSQCLTALDLVLMKNL